MAGILNHQGLFYQLGPLSTEDFRNRLLDRNLPPPVNETLTQSGLVSKLDDIGNIINVPILGVSSELERFIELHKTLILIGLHHKMMIIEHMN